jgi:hypothetical protein
VLVNADFVVIALKAAIGKLLLVHDPLWVVASDLAPLPAGEHVTALTMIGDGTKHHMHDLFLALGPPAQQVQARSVLENDRLTFTAGEPGGRIAPGAWQPARMGSIQAMALNDADGRLWVAEGDAIPKRISVWSTDQVQGSLIREFFAPPGPDTATAIDPLDPLIVFAAGCEWRIDSHSGRSSCLGIVTTEAIRAARFEIQGNRTLLILTPRAPEHAHEIMMERTGEGSYRVVTDAAPTATPAKYQLSPGEGNSWQLVSSDGYILGSFFGATGSKPITSSPKPPAGEDWKRLCDSPGTPTLTQAVDGKLYLTAGRARIWTFEITGIDKLRPLGSGSLSIPSKAQ